MLLYAAKSCSALLFLENIVQRTYGISPLPTILRDGNGKPYFPDHPNLHFNFSHTGPYVLCALSLFPVGVDMEEIKARRPSLPRYALTPEEYRCYEQLGGDWNAFYTLWTKKEAWCKYTGEGLGIGLKKTPSEDGVFFKSYKGADFCACVCGEEAPPAEITWIV